MLKKAKYVQERLCYPKDEVSLPVAGGLADLIRTVVIVIAAFITG